MGITKKIKKEEFKRYGQLFSVLTKYGFEDILANSRIKKLLPKEFLRSHPDSEKTLTYSNFERIRMVLEELGPTYVKLGQVLSNREDLIPQELIFELEKLQDQATKLDNFDIYKTVEEELDITISEHFQSIEHKPLAAASLAQVHRAKLLNGQEVILKVQRPKIRKVIEADLLIMKHVSRNLEKYSSTMRSFQPVLLVSTFEKSIKEELRYLREIENTQKFARNFKDNESIYVAQVHVHLSNDRIICMEYLEGIKISEIEELKSQGFNPVQVAHVGVDLYMEQVLEHGFFHADPHPGNIFLLHEMGKLSFLDFGMMGVILPKDRELLSELLVYFLQKDTKRIVFLLEKLAVKTDIKDLQKLDQDLYIFMESISDTAIKNIRIGPVLTNLKEILHENKVVLPHYFYMLIRGIVMIEGVGLKLDPNFDITKNLRPYVNNIQKRQFGFKKILTKNLERIKNVQQLMDTLPEDFGIIIKKIKDGKLVVKHQISDISRLQSISSKLIDRLVFAIIIAALSIGSAILVLADAPPKVYGVPVLGAVGFLLSAVLGFYIVLSMFKKK
ncbi:AarF/ABC1/UbiB kinase family protein [Ulvibacterium sp.]|uniref:ABC1 kinase family protein n=1 Tax=Ulvibacterium sp. TaxID=2665914 RepID=UPI00262A77E6|nr:AarF/ABC1/UbiB kinase family protein [Ulvibacterium sp.]